MLPIILPRLPIEIVRINIFNLLLNCQVLEWILKKMLNEIKKTIVSSMNSSMWRVRRAINTFHQKKKRSYKHVLHTYHIFTSTFSKSGIIDAMLAWHSAKKAAGLGFDLQMFESVILGCFNSRKYQISDRTFEEMMFSDIIPSVSHTGMNPSRGLRAEEFGSS